MKICIVFDAFGYGGAEKIGSNYAKMLSELGHEVTVINLTPSEDAMKSQLAKPVKYIGYYFSQYLCADYYYILVKAFWWGKYFFPLIYAFLSIIGKLHSLITRIRFDSYDLCIAFAGHINDMNFVGRNYIRARNRICWFHGAIFQKFLYSDAYVDLCNKMDVVVVLNEECQEQTFMANHFMKRFKTRKIYNPIYMNTSTIDIEKANEIKRKYGEFLVMSARLSYPHKDHYTVIKALSVLHKQYNQKISLVLLGDGPEKEKLVAHTGELGVADYVFFVGSVNNVQDYYAASKVLVHASIAGEGLPTVLLEAMACGIPVVATDSSVGPKEIIGNNEYGLLCGVRDYEGMAESVNRLLTDVNLYNYYIEQGLKRIKVFRVENIKNNIKELIEELSSK
jgi:glycosyltransferase involved in cell wall biosynthesis